MCADGVYLGIPLTGTVLECWPKARSLEHKTRPYKLLFLFGGQGMLELS